MARIPRSGIAEACDQIVDRYGPRGKAQEKLAQLHADLTAELEQAKEHERQYALKCEVAYLEGYMETPAAKIADIKWATKGIKKG